MGQHAVLVAVEHYADPKIQRVVYAAADALGLEAALKDLGVSVVTILDSQATKTALKSKLKKLVDGLGAADTLYFFYAAHGFSQNGQNFVTCHDTQYGDLKKTSLSLKWIYDLFKASACKRVVIFLDCCESGMQIDKSMRTIIGELSETELNEFFAQAEYVVGFASCKTDQSSWPVTKLKHGVWTYCLIEALSGNAKAAIEKDGLITSSSLQNFLSIEVPKELKRHRPNEVQTPWKFGGETNDFLVADVSGLIAARRKPPPFDPKQLKQLYFRAIDRGLIRSLSGFSKKRGHTVPPEFNDATDGFVRRIAHREIETDLAAKHAEFRQGFRYKRTEMVSTDPDEGNGSIDTSGFTYSVTVRQDQTKVERYELIREVVLKDPDVLMSDAFNEVFADTFETLEFEFSKPVDLEEVIDQLEEAGIDVEYDRGATYCTFRLPGFPMRVEARETSLRFVHSSPQSPRELSEAFLKFRQLAAKKDLKLLPVL